MVHRDVKPANILLTEGSDGDEERVYLTDFGVAKAMGEIEAQATALTTAGGVVATLDYAAPEQIEGKTLDGRCDVYALGCVLFKLLTGVIPYPGENLGAKVYARMHLPPPAPSDTVPALPAGFDAVVAKALAKDPADRYQTCRALAASARAALATAPRGSTTTERVGDPDATQALLDSPRSADPYSQPPRDAYSQPPREQYSQPQNSLPPNGQPQYGQPQYPAPQWDARSEPPRSDPGRYPPQGNVQQYGQQPTQRVDPGYGYGGPNTGSTSADSLPPHLAQFLGAGQPPPPVAPRGPSRSSIRRRRSWLAVGVLVVVAAIVVGVSLLQKRNNVGNTAGSGSSTSAASSPSRPGTTSAKTSAASTAKSSPAKSSPASSGRSTAASSATGSTPAKPSTSTSATKATPATVKLAASAPLPAQTLITSRKNGAAYALFAMDLTDNSKSVQITPDNADNAGPVLSRQRGSVIYIRGSAPTTSQIRTVTAAGGEDRQLFPNPKGCSVINDVAWNWANQQQLALDCTDDAGKLNLYLVDLTGKITATISPPGLAKWDDLTFSPDGELIAFWGSESGDGKDTRIYTLTTDGTGTLTPVTEAGTNDVDPDFSPDGRQIAYACTLPRNADGTGGNVSQICVVGVDGGEVTDLTDRDSPSAGPSWSPDGTKIAFKNNGSENKFEIWVVNPTLPGDPSAAISGFPGSVAGSPSWGNR